MNYSNAEIVVTGIGVYNTIGIHADSFWEQLLAGKNGLRKIDLFDVSEQRAQTGCQLTELLPSAWFASESETMGRTTRIVLPPIEEALLQAGLDQADCSGGKTGLCIGTTMGEIEPLEKAMRGDPNGQTGGPHAIAEQIATLLALQGPIWTFTNACAAGNFAIARSMDELRSGRADRMIAAGVDAMSWAAFTGFNSLRAMSTDACRPFDVTRKGLILGEGAGVLVMERRESAEARGVTPLAHILGYGMTSDAHHITRPDPKAKGAVRAMREAVAMAGIHPDQIDYVSAHGTGTMANDRMEATALREVFANHPTSVKVSSIKGHIGHTLGAASAIEAVMSVKALQTQMLPPTLHLENLDPACVADSLHMLREPWRGKVSLILSNSYAFGGVNSSIVLSAPQEGGVFHE
ncbi:beta-ketoacyl-[acyl-carrier-protein] synthase family protein [Marinicrinis sediminis]|uniref:Beta-ketoacyl-[acyl-carrier-protein] synthase family protein n=1 Tax=Marinicrinis sediminis TaxID=1652465 RepID=A0ABW5RE05_9BACL